MNIDTRNDHRTIGNRPRRGARPPRRQLDSAAIAATERDIEAHPITRKALEISESRTLARITEQVIALGLEAVEKTASCIRRQLEAVGRDASIAAMHRAEALRVRLVDPESDVALWRRKMASALNERECLEVELAAWTRKR
jgi:hypothetical protein